MEEGGELQPRELTFSMTQLSRCGVGRGGARTQQGRLEPPSSPGPGAPGLEVGPQESQPCDLQGSLLAPDGPPGFNGPHSSRAGPIFLKLFFIF